MKIKLLTIKNIGILKDIELEINKPLILFYGDIKNGKTTILNAIRWVFGGKFPSDIIRHGADDAEVVLAFDNGSISRSWYRAKDGVTKAREIVYVVNGRPQARPAEKIRALLNPFLLDQDFLRNKTELERKQYFAELFAVDTGDLDGELIASQEDAEETRAKIKAYGEIDLKPVEEVDVAAAKAKLAEIRKEHEEKTIAIEKENEGIGNYNRKVEKAKEAHSQIIDEITRLTAELKTLNERHIQAEKWLETYNISELKEKPKAPNTESLEAQIQDGAAQSVRAERYKENKAKAEQKKRDEQALAAMEKRHRDIKAEKQARLKDVSEKCGIPGLSFDDDGNFVYEGSTAGMVSDSQLIRLSSELSALYPPGFGLDLLDRAESLGKSIFGFIERAKREDKTILATIVGERPASVPDEVGVFVVVEGKVVK